MTRQEQITLKVAQRVADHQIANFLKRGLNNTGRTVKSWCVEINKSGRGGAEAVVLALPHVINLNRGVTARNIPYQRGSGNKNSEFINGLMRYFRSKGLGIEEAKKAAFATANAAKGRNNDGRGMPADKNKLGFLDLNAAQIADVNNYMYELTNEYVFSITKMVA